MSSKINTISFPFSDTIAGYIIVAYDNLSESFTMRVRSGDRYRIKLKKNTHVQILRNLTETNHHIYGCNPDMLAIGRFLFVYGIFYPESNEYSIEAQELIFLGEEPDVFAFTSKDWWIKQITTLSQFYLNAEFEQGIIDYKNYRTTLSMEGKKLKEDFRQETSTISRMIGGFASAFMLTGEMNFLEVANKGIEYLQNHMRFYDLDEKIIYWYHGIDVYGTKEYKIFSSQFGDDFDAISAYEQIYSLAGLSLIYRVTRDPRLLKDIQLTMDLFDRFFFDNNYGGYFTHLDPHTLDPRSDRLKNNCARKNWNSIGDHLPVYLIHLWLATGEEKYAKKIEYLADLIVNHFPDYENSPFVIERFLEDWTPDRTHSWQQDRAIVGHNLKIAWNLMRIYNCIPKPEYKALAIKIAELMPTVGLDLQRGGWYDAMERTLKDGEMHYRFAFHDRKAWWQQEQGILAYMILYGELSEDKYKQIANESAAFYNAFFLDHDNNGIFFNTFANGMPYMDHTEKLKGSHSISSCHSFELALIGQIYNNLILTQQTIDLYFYPYTKGLKEGLFHAIPEMLSPGKVRISHVWLDEKPYEDFDSDTFIIRLPKTPEQIKVKVRYEPV